MGDASRDDRASCKLTLRERLNCLTCINRPIDHRSFGSL